MVSFSNLANAIHCYPIGNPSSPGSNITCTCSNGYHAQCAGNGLGISAYCASNTPGNVGATCNEGVTPIIHAVSPQTNSTGQGTQAPQSLNRTKVGNGKVVK